jgi:hypothetical protein
MMPAMKKSIPTEQSEANIAEVLRLLSGTPRKFADLAKGLSEKKLREPLGDGERSFIECLAHLINCEALTADSIYLALMLNEPSIAPVHAERDLGKLLRFDQQNVNDLLAYFTFRRAILLQVLDPLPPKKWSRAIREHGKQRKESVYWRARGQALHELEHLTDLERKLKK